MKVVKFGGSSLANAEQFKKVGDIVRADRKRRYVIPSAPGKRFPGDTKVTDLLYKMEEQAENGEDYSETFEEIKSRFTEIIEGLALAMPIMRHPAVSISTAGSWLPIWGIHLLILSK